MIRPLPVLLEMHPVERRAMIVGGRFTVADRRAARLAIIDADGQPQSIDVSADVHAGLWSLLIAANVPLAPFLTILAAQYGDPKGRSVLIDTMESGRKAISQSDTPELWAQFQAWEAAGNTIVDYVPPPAPQKREFTVNEFLARMSPAQQVALVTLGSEGPAAARLWYLKFSGARSISIDDPTTAAGLDYLIANTNGAFTTADKASLLGPA